LTVAIIFLGLGDSLSQYPPDLAQKYLKKSMDNLPQKKFSFFGLILFVLEKETTL
jgi:hypothetical protein